MEIDEILFCGRVFKKCSLIRREMHESPVESISCVASGLVYIFRDFVVSRFVSVVVRPTAPNP